jgi:predicted Zn finger-like uncharacterized protein
MILKCTYCSGKMRVDEKSIPEGKWVKVKCPHCSGIGLAGRQHPGEGAIPGGSIPPQAAPSPMEPAAPDGRLAYHTTVDEPSLPQDAFKGFRFPAETEAVAVKESPPKKSGLRILAWIGASLGIVLLFALVVNLVLPGPLK